MLHLFKIFINDSDYTREKAVLNALLSAKEVGDCQECPKGQFCKVGTSVPENCTAGYFCNGGKLP